MTPPNEAPTTVRLTPETLKRADKLVRALKRPPEASLWGRTSRSLVLRSAVGRGLDAVEVEYATPPRKR